MAKRKAAAKKAGSAAKAARDNPYIQRLVEDEDLRNTLRDAYGSAREVLHRLNNGKAPSQALMKDKKLQKQLKEAATGFRDAAETLREGPKKPKRAKRGGGGLLILLVGGVAAIALSSGLRKKLLDTLFGAEEEFDYTSSASSSSQSAAEKTTV